MEVDEWRSRAEHTEGQHDEALEALLATKAELGELSHLQVRACSMSSTRLLGTKATNGHHSWHMVCKRLVPRLVLGGLVGTRLVPGLVHSWYHSTWYYDSYYLRSAVICRCPAPIVPAPAHTAFCRRGCTSQQGRSWLALTRKTQSSRT